MDSYDVRRLALVFAIQAEIEGMKIDNKIREINGDTRYNFPIESFQEKAEELRNLSYCHNEQL